MTEDLKRFQHDCNACIFIGQYEKYDLYWCKDIKYPRLDSILARYGSKDSQYISHHPPGAFAEPHEFLKKAPKWYHFVLKKAQELGLYDPRKQGPDYYLTTDEEKIRTILDLIRMEGGIDGAHHKQWVLDQIVKIATDCPKVKITKEINGNNWSYEILGESDEYKEWVRKYEEGYDGPKTYEWDVGIAP